MSELPAVEALRCLPERCIVGAYIQSGCFVGLVILRSHNPVGVGALVKGGRFPS